MLSDIVEAEDEWHEICDRMDVPTHNWEQMTNDLHDIMGIQHSRDTMSDFLVERLHERVENGYDLDEICHECGQGIDRVVLEADGNYHRTCVEYRG